MSATLTTAASEGFDATLEQAKQTARLSPAEAIEILDQLIGDGPQSQSLSDQARLFAFRAELNRDLGQLQQARDDAERATSLADQSGENDIKAEALRVLGTIDAEQGDVSAALQRFHAAWSLLEEETDPNRLRLAVALGVGHQMLENHARASDYFNKALDLARTLGNRSQQATILGNLAIAECELDSPEESLALHEQSLDLFRELDHAVGVATQLANVCDRRVELGQTEEALSICLEAIDRLESLGNARLLAGVRGSLGTLYEQRDDLDAALETYSLALAQAEGKIPTVERDVLERLARLHSSRGEPRQALAVYQRLMAARERLWEERNRQTIEELEVQYQLRERELELQRSRTESELQSSVITLQARLLIVAGVALILLIALIAIGLRNNRERARLQDDLADRNTELEDAVETISRLATRDPLTELRNRRAFANVAEQAMAQSRRNEERMGILMVDIDHFKQLNDRHGHSIGDLVLKDIATLLLGNLREQDVLCRWGGEEFLMLLPNTDVDEALNVAERARQAIDQTTIELEGASLHVTVTIGVARVGDDLDKAIDAADQAMYEGKRAGRNRVMLEAPR